MAGTKTLGLWDMLFSITNITDTGSAANETTAPTKPVSITLIDDDADDRMLFNDVFKSFNKITASTFKSADDFLNSRKWGTSYPDVILLDLNMPGMNGFECLHALKAHDGYDRTKVYVYSTSDEEEYVAQAYELGALAYIRKPYSYSGLHDMAKFILTESTKENKPKSLKNFLHHFE